MNLICTKVLSTIVHKSTEIVRLQMSVILSLKGRPY
jgi:hypothetical protein